MTSGGYMDVKQASELTSIPERQIKKFIVEGYIIATVLPQKRNKYRIHRNNLQDFMNNIRPQKKDVKQIINDLRKTN